MITTHKNGVVGLYTAFTKAAKVNGWSYRKAISSIKSTGKYEGFDVVLDIPENLPMKEYELIKLLSGEFDREYFGYNPDKEGYQLISVRFRSKGSEYDFCISLDVTARESPPNHKWNDVEVGEMDSLANQEGELMKLSTFTEELIKSKIEL